MSTRSQSKLLFYIKCCKTLIQSCGHWRSEQGVKLNWITHRKTSHRPLKWEKECFGKSITTGRKFGSILIKVAGYLSLPKRGNVALTGWAIIVPRPAVCMTISIATSFPKDSHAVNNAIHCSCDIPSTASITRVFKCWLQPSFSVHVLYP